ncbi:YegP family protein [Flavobacterium sp. ZT3R18]|uniref:YegP family protein n=1 Tax=Flavobacterium sp. ZT3R18 TaxID=2594429 RepID=UPI00210403B6|nr:YegP family protein [Flavobacterium sp. ZT3R18]
MKFNRKKSPNGNMFYFNIKSSNGKVIAISELFEEKEIRDFHITSIKSGVLNAAIEDFYS